MRAFFKALFDALLDALRAWQRDLERDAALRGEAAALNELRSVTDDLETAARVTRAVDAVRHDGGLRDPADPGGPDPRGYRD